MYNSQFTMKQQYTQEPSLRNDNYFVSVGQADLFHICPPS